MTICIVTRSLSCSLPAVAMAKLLARFGQRVFLLVAPLVPEEESPRDATTDEGLIVHRLPVPRWPGSFGRRQARRRAIGRVLRRLEPQVVQLADERDRGIAVPPGTVVLQSMDVGVPSRCVDAGVTLDGRFLDRSGVPIECPGVPPLPTSAGVAEGLDADSSASQWRVSMYLAGIDQLRRSRRVRLDPAPQCTFLPPSRTRPNRRVPLSSTLLVMTR